MKHMLVTGGAGFIGSNFVRYMLGKHDGYRITVLDALTYAGHLENLDDVKDDPRFTFIKGDIRIASDVAKPMADADIVVNFAAESHVDRSIAEPEAFKIKCDVHPWETAWCHVMSHPFHSVSDAEGRFMIGGLAPGEYQLEFRHEHWTMVTQTMTIRVDADKPLRLDDVKFTPVEDDERDRHRPRRAASKPAGEE